MTQSGPTEQNLSREEAFARLSFYVEAGVSDHLADESQNRYQLEPDAAAPDAVTDEAPRRTTSRNAPSRSMGEAPPAVFRPSAPAVSALDDAAAIDIARQLAAGAATLDALREAVAGFDGCSLRKTAKNLVFEDGNRQARVMLIGEAPGSDEDIDGVPFAGEAGRLLDRMLAAIGLDRSGIYLANLLPWRPPGNRAPNPGELAMCLPFITRQIELCAPEILVLAGGLAPKQLLGIDTPLPRLRGQWKPYRASGTEIPALTMLSPQFLLDYPGQKKLAWQDLQALQARLGELGDR
tara:strand:- start:241 stop:1122 length:882 start_codon:yes stop_codon:yes gene_type:complete